MLLPGVVLRCLDALGLSLKPAPTVLVIVCLALLLYRWLRSDRTLASPSQTPGAAVGIFLVALMALLLVRNFQLLLDVAWRPLYAWDAWVNWAPKAKVWFYEGRLVDFVSPADWLHALPGESVRTLVTWRYPETIPLIQLWMALCAGRWDDLAINLPWAFCAPALAVAMLGQLRSAGILPVPAALAPAVMLTTPFTNVHSFLAGYADIWMASWVCLGAMALWNHSRQPAPAQRGLLLLCILVCPLIKLPGTIFAAILAFAWWVSGGKAWRLPAAAVLAALLGLTMLVGVSLELPGGGRLLISAERLVLPRIGEYALGVHNIWPAVRASLFFSGNWHFLWFVLPVGLFWLNELDRRSRVACVATLLPAYAFVFGVFFLTERYVDAANLTSLNRAVLHIVPMSIYWLAFVCGSGARGAAETSRELSRRAV
jgi:hypothetical protein